jgi:formylglycine-generating enzyme required for sulfatase activity
VQAQGQAQILTFPCRVGKGEYTPPELQGTSFETTIRHPENDHFGLGVLIFQMLMDGNHPFRGKWLQSGEPPTIEAKIAQGLFPYGGQAGRGKVSPPPNVTLDILHPRVSDLVQRCFVDGHNSPRQRPTADEWDDALGEAEKALVQCRNGHYYSNHLRACPTCGARTGKAQTPLPPAQAAGTTTTTVAPAQAQGRSSLHAPSARNWLSSPWSWFAGIALLLLLALNINMAGGGIGTAPESPAPAVNQEPEAGERPENEVAVVEDADTPAPPTATPEPTALPASLTTEIAPGVTMEFVQVPAGPFLMGSSEDDPDADYDEFPRHELTLPTYYIGRTEVTNAQFRPFVEGDGYSNADYWTEDGWAWREERSRTQPYYWDDEEWNGDEQPVNGISWYEAMAYTRWLSARTGEEYRLPTEPEWEKAACGTGSRIYPWGDEAPYGERANFGTSYSDGGRTVSVGSYPAGVSPYGALDMAGNVWEWTGSEYQDYPYDAAGSEYQDYPYEEVNEGVSRVTHRGGGYSSNKTYVRCAARYRYTPNYGGVLNHIGLRVLFSPRVLPN